MLTKEDVIAALGKGRSLTGMYRTRDGKVFRGQAASNVGSDLVGAGWRGVSNIDSYDLKRLGCEVVEGETMRAGGSWSGRFVQAVVKSWD